YFPPDDRHNLPGFPRVLQAVADAYQRDPDGIAETAASVLTELRRMNLTRESDAALDAALLDAAYQGIARGYDKRFGGFGAAPKFPAAMLLEFLLRTYHRTGDRAALDMITHTCRRMAEGGMYDQLGGGFHRYSTDARWLVPHFEKMLYDNALLSRLYLHVYQATGDQFFRRIVEETLDYVARELTDARGGFYSTQDADSEGVEGKFFVWSQEEIMHLLGPADGALVCAYYDVSPAGNFEGENILNVPRPAEVVAQEARLTVEELLAAVERARPVLFKTREGRVKPGRDEKVLTAWNGMMLVSFAEAAATLARADYREIAERNASFILTSLRREGALLHVYKDGQAKQQGFLDDYACAAQGLLALYEATGTTRWLEAAHALIEEMNAEFWDGTEGGFFYTAGRGEQLIVRQKDFFDNATPSGNSVAAEVLLRLAVLTETPDYQRKAVTLFRLMRDLLTRHPSGFGCLLGALDFYLSTPKEIALVGEPEHADLRRLAHEVWRRYLPNKVVALAAEGDEQARAIVPLLRDRPALGGRPTAYVCENYTCQQPVTTPEELAAQLDA
ncbi:MAG TPA: thioredoxin domain-containing protein, partial [Pyrinomonadaceae bacterium]|nr:thioredoxin domain-containing protein [Pyrinomonadaceae bacterium]